VGGIGAGIGLGAGGATCGDATGAVSAAGAAAIASGAVPAITMKMFPQVHFTFLPAALSLSVNCLWHCGQVVAMDMIETPVVESLQAARIHDMRGESRDFQL